MPLSYSDLQKMDYKSYYYPHFSPKILLNELSDYQGLDAGNKFPSFKLTDPRGQFIDSEDFLGKVPFLISVSSMTCPMTRSSSPVLRELHQEFGGRIKFLSLYVREAHPGSRFPQPKTIEEKQSHALQYKRRDNISWPVVVDDMEGNLHKKLGLHTNVAYLVDRNGLIAYRVRWSNDKKLLRKAILSVIHRDQGLDGKHLHSVITPALNGLGAMGETLDEAGLRAKTDMFLSAAPFYIIGELAKLFKTRSYKTRSILSLSALGLAGVGTYLWYKKQRKD